MILSDVLIDDVSIKFDDIDECVELKNRLIAFLKSKRRDIRDKGIEPEMIFNIKNKNNG